MKELIIWGSSGHAKVLEELFNFSEYRIVALVDNNKEAKSVIANTPLLNGIEGFTNWLKQRNNSTQLYGIVAIGGALGLDRLKIQKLLVNKNVKIINAIHPFSYLAKNTCIGEGTQILAGAVIASSANIGNGVIINTASSIDHECILHDGVHIGPGATLAGCVEVGSCTFIGAGAVVLPRIKIGKACCCWCWLGRH
jgi:sugar O-acyltransferase (sialic acid O-acetyltransferase NeuD family)